MQRERWSTWTFPPGVEAAERWAEAGTRGPGQALTSCVSSGRWSPFLLPSLISRSRYRDASGLSESLCTFS